MSSPDPIRVIVLYMIKNESRIITRSIQSALKIADAICVSDTGSTDNTVQILKDFYPTLPIPAKTYDHPWTNFGTNRTKSFNDAKQFCYELDWHPARTYVLVIDADMELVVEPSFNKQTDLGQQQGYSIIQKAGTLHYANARFLRLDHMWTCKGATHEYWDGPMGPTISDSKIWINDRNDGGCKADKFTRDRDLLIQELKEQPQNVRTHFYLAQTYKCLGQKQESIDMYIKRIELGGWYEEVWYSYYMIGQLYLEMDKPYEAELWVQKGQKHSNYRAEALYLLVKHFRIAGDQWKAMHYYRLAKQIPKPAVALFLESEVYDHLLDYEYTVLQYYVNPLRIEGARASMRYMLKDQSVPLLDNVASNMEFYVEDLKEASQPEDLKTPQAIGPYRPSSVSVTRYQGSLITNVRYVNYHTSDQGAYTARDPENIVRTQNLCLRNDQWSKLFPTTDASSGTEFVKEDPSVPIVPTNVMGLEDVRIFNDGSGIVFTAATKSLTADGRIHMAYGTYDLATNAFTNVRVIPSPIGAECEKNWLFVPSEKGTSKVIYRWYPFQAGILQEGKLVLTTTHAVPPYFKQLRGSANGTLYNNKIVCLTHVVKYGSPRKYYHHLITLDPTTLKPQSISLPFYFKTHGIEYCLGLDIVNDTVTFYYSTFDANPRTITVPYNKIEFLNL
jgi:glycosyltransferase involved in cell wall biosynthesis